MPHYITEMNILFRVRTNKTIQTLYYRVTLHKQRSTDQTTCINFTQADGWNASSQTFARAPQYNELLARIRLSLQSAYLALGESATAKQVSKRIDVRALMHAPAVPELPKEDSKEKPKKATRKNYDKEIEKHLTETQMNLLESTVFEKKLQKYADILIILMRTGINYSDYKKIDWKTAIKNTENGELIVIERSKTNQRAIIPLFPIVKKILEKNNYKMRIYHHSGLAVKFEELGKLIGVEHLTPKYGRKTMATFCLDNGVSIEVAAKILGHAGTQMIQRHYAVIGEKRVMAEFKGLI